MAPCFDCPHLKISEGGTVPEAEAVQGVGRFADSPHPCHNVGTSPCRGHLRDLKMVKLGISRYNGDVVRTCYDLRIGEGRVLSGVFSHEEIALLRHGADPVTQSINRSQIRLNLTRAVARGIITQEQMDEVLEPAVRESVG